MPRNQVFKQPTFFLNSFTRFEPALGQNWKAAYLASGFILHSWSALRLPHAPCQSYRGSGAFWSILPTIIKINSIIESFTAFMQKLTSLKDLLFLIQFLVSSWEFWGICKHACLRVHAPLSSHACMSVFRGRDSL